LGAAAFLAFANLSWDFVYLWVTQPRKVRSSIPIIPRTVNGGVEVWRGGVGEAYPLADPFVGRCLTSLAVPLIPHPAHRTGRAERPHPALGERLTVTPTENCSSVW